MLAFPDTVIRACAAFEKDVVGHNDRSAAVLLQAVKTSWRKLTRSYWPWEGAELRSFAHRSFFCGPPMQRCNTFNDLLAKAFGVHVGEA